MCLQGAVRLVFAAMGLNKVGDTCQLCFECDVPHVTLPPHQLTAHCGYKETYNTSLGTLSARGQVQMGRVKGKGEEEGEEEAKMDLLYRQPGGGCLCAFVH